MAAQHVVGGSQGWEESTDFSSWASGQKFKVGDQLVFKYASGLHSVVELGGESAYKSCDLGTPLNSMNTGNDVVKLSKPGHCGQGMKVKITVESGTAPSTPESSSSSSSPAASSASAMHKSFAASALLAALVAASLINIYM
ncbi:hypothetical protein OIU85_001936 [Salix viminalis]|uniref:Phytocyanin domain-containing protein n=1 Tax=Salix viminalis TaxID=40686 RepID=A0A9Q0ZYC0_SALVM|nr:hypothetical protein OIU85_001936 [Salix viminalis]